jgi:hypothetical protein
VLLLCAAVAPAQSPRPIASAPTPSTPALQQPVLPVSWQAPPPPPAFSPSTMQPVPTPSVSMPPPPPERAANWQVNPPSGSGALTIDDQTDQTYQLEPPGRDRLFRLESEDALKERMRQESKTRSKTDRIIFPDEPILSRDTYYGRNWPTRQLVVEPNYLCYGRLLFEQKNMERYGWDLGPVGAVLSPLEFFADCVTLPYHGLTDPFRCCECSAGYCLPGDPVPLLLYPPELSASGSIGEAAAVLAVIAIFP